MPREIVTINIGQCGNQLGCEFFKKICAEHGIGSDGSLLTNENINDRKDIFFYQADNQRYIPRSINVDLEPRVVDWLRCGEFKNFYNPENLIVPTNNGAGNSWANGYFTVEKMNEIEDVIDREVENCDSMEGFFFCHSICGGTGSGLGSKIMELISDKYPKCTTQAFSVMTRNHPDVVVSPYNSILTLKRLITECQSVVVFDNEALADIAHSQFGIEEATAFDMNNIISYSMSAFTANMRFPSTLYSGMDSLIFRMCPSRFAHFLVTGFVPLFQSERPTGRTSATDIMKRLLQPQNMMAKVDLKKGKYMSICDFFQGDVGYEEINEALQIFTDKRLADFVPWNKDSLEAIHTRSSPLIQRGNRMSGMTLSNNTSIRFYFQDILNSFNQMFQKKVFLESYKEKFEDNLQEFEESKEIVRCLIDEYEKAETQDYLNYQYPIYEWLKGMALQSQYK
ncbi:tubulin gamma chain, putative [Entamoeba invadens IP1]|uniref:tubulin gamma chain, putative n=1 Tax=Entamoeba invadens IP1 TaxID=370355 RepID=UPI0002C3D9E3|nr:tubulin gamma chain, putative [Entamoeba invadens IP1]ELP93280.1 tubulin gamma chain, putative [Entamoeba invadens IP1]|eukprot:XP_004260051.1 tubulin gamma chain, putative [Entamoeba invadens IP1]